MKTTILTVALVLISLWSVGQEQKTNETDKMKTAELNEQQVQALTMLAHGLSTPPRTPIVRTPEDMGMEFEEVEFTTSDGVIIKGWYIPAETNRIIISNHFSPGNRYGFAGHMEGLDFAGGFEVNFIPRYKALHDAGYNILTYDLRSHGESGESKDKISGVGYFEWQEVLASIEYVRRREETSNMDISLFSMCMGANATINAMEKSPETFASIKSLILVQPLKGQTSVERSCTNFGIPVDAGVSTFEPIYSKITGLTIEDHDITKKIKYINVPTFYLQVRNDLNSRASDVQWMYDNTPVEDKKISWVEDTPWRFHGYTYFSENPEQMVEWYDAHMK
jgi:esterase/lipase